MQGRRKVFLCNTILLQIYLVISFHDLAYFYDSLFFMILRCQVLAIVLVAVKKI